MLMIKTPSGNLQENMFVHIPVSEINNTAMIKEQYNYQLVEEYGTDHQCYSKTISYSNGFYAMM